MVMSALDTDYKVLINVETPKNKFVHILNQAEREDQVLFHIFVQNKTLLQWEIQQILKDNPTSKY
jgi:hypothetical protein